MKKIIFLIVCSLFVHLSFAQVGIGTTNPKASLDITASNVASPTNTDGILIPRVDAFPVINPTAAQQGMMVYLTTTTGSNSPGFYYWDNGTTTWISVSGGVDNDWTIVGNDIERQTGNVYIGDTNLTNNDFYISNKLIDWDNILYSIDPDNISRVDEIVFDNGSVTDPSIRFSDSDTGFFSPSYAATAYSVNGLEAFRISNTRNISIGNTNSLNYKLLVQSPIQANKIYLGNVGYGTNDDVMKIEHNSQRGDALQINMTNGYNIVSKSAINAVNDLANVSTKIAKFEPGFISYGVENIIDGTINSPFIYGIKNTITNTGNGTKYGSYNLINTSAGGTHYGVYSDVQKSTGFAGYFIGRTSLGTSTSRYIMPLTDGTANQIMQTDGAGQVSFVNSNTVGTDDQNLTGATLTGTNLQIDIENGNSVAVDLAPLQDGTGTDDQTINTFSFNTGTKILTLEVENDGIAPLTVNLSSLQDGNTQNTLDQAYDQGGAGAGRTITADNGAVAINGTDGFQITGILNSGAAISLSGAGTRMFFNPRKGAFRAGSVAFGGSNNPNVWNDVNVGVCSFASGLSTTASASCSTSMGYKSTASNVYSTAIGYRTTASGSSSTAMGISTTASGTYSTVMGTNTTAPSYVETVMGSFNTAYNPQSTTVWNNTDRLFVIGNGIDAANKSNALTIYKNGLMNINDAYNMPLTDGTANQVMATNGAGQVSFVNSNTVGTDDQNLTGATLTGTNLQIDIENGSSTTVDLVALKNTLDQAYDQGGAGAGRTINTTDGAVLLNGTDGLKIQGAQAGIEIANTTENESGIHFRDAGNTTQYADINYDNGTNNLLNFYVNSATASMTLDDNQRVGIGTTTPSEKLSVAGTANLNEGLNGVALRVNGTEALWYNGTQFSWGFGGTENYFADKVGIGTNSPAYKLDVADTQSGNYVAQVYNKSTNANADGLRIRLQATNPDTANYFIGFYDGSNTQRGRITGNGTGVTYNTSSDRRLKTHIVNIDHALEIINKMQPRKYEFKANRGVEEYGFIAQELQLVYPQAVSGDPNGDVKTDPMMVDYSRLTPILTAGIKELKKEVKILKNKNLKQENEIKELKLALSNYTQLKKRLQLIEKKLN